MQQNKGKGNGNVKKEANPKEKKKFKEFLHKFFKFWCDCLIYDCGLFRRTNHTVVECF